MTQATNTKPHYIVLDGLRGVAALVVVWYHVFESYATSMLDQKVNHGYLAVDFFFLLSGFVMSYAYDDRWGQMGFWGFVRRRLIRLQPMVIFGALFGALMFYTQETEFWPVASISLISLLGATVLNALMIPSSPGMEIRGFGEIYPLNGPTWSLFFEYIGNVVYALILRRLPRWALAIVVAVLGGALVYHATSNSTGSIGLGWSMTTEQIVGGSLRFFFSFSAGLLMARTLRPRAQVKDSFWLCSTALIALLVLPRLGGESGMWINGLYDSLCAIILFPLILYIGASQRQVGATTERICRWLGDLSYPLYLIHYPLLYTYYAWVKNEGLPFGDSWPGAFALFFGSIALALFIQHFLEAPLRRYLSKRFA